MLPNGDARNESQQIRLAGEAPSDHKPSELVRGLGLWASMAVIIGGMVGQSIFLVSSQVASDWIRRRSPCSMVDRRSDSAIRLVLLC